MGHQCLYLIMRQYKLRNPYLQLICNLVSTNQLSKKYNCTQENMKEDSLLSNVSNVSYHANSSGIDFFNDSGHHGAFNELKVKQEPQQQEIDLNCLPAFNHNEPVTPKQNGLLMAAYWTDQNNRFEGSSDIEASHIQEQYQELQQSDQKVKIESDIKLEATLEPMIKMEHLELEFQNEDQQNDRIGTVTKNETKNIPKNYGKAIITYIEKERLNFEHILNIHGVKYEDLMSELAKKKKYINTIANLRDLWVEFKYARCMRILSNQFLRKYALQYIFNSRICNYTSHVKYRKRLQEAIETPGSFRHIKQY